MPTPRFRRPEAGFCKELAANDLQQGPHELAVNQECGAGCECPLASHSDGHSSEILKIAEAWPSLPGHVKQTIITLVESATAGQQSEGGVQ